MQAHFSPFATVLLAAALVVGEFPKAHAAEPADAATILAQMQRASGGDRWETVHALHILTNALSGGQTVKRDSWKDVATGRYEISERGPFGAVQGGFDGVTPWRQGESGIGYALGDIDSSLVAANESFRVACAWWFRDRHPSTITFSRVLVENGQSFDVLTITPEGGRPFEAWVDRNTHLLARTDEQQAEDRVVTAYSDYRSVEQLMIPFTVRTGDGADSSFDDVESVESVEINPIVPTQAYAIPPLPASDVRLPPGLNSIDIPFRLTPNNKIILSAILNGRTIVDAQFDTGGSLLLQPQIASKIGAANVGQLKESGGGEGSTTSTRGRLDTLQIGAAQISALSFHSFAFNSDAPDEILVGQEILQRFVVHLDFDRMVMTLTKPDAFKYADGGAEVPFHFQDNQPEVKGSIDGIAGLFAIDTGDDSSLLLIAPFARRYDLVKKYRADIPYDGRSISATHGVYARKRAATVSINGPDGRPIVAVHQPVTRISLQHSGFDANRNVSANIGLGILKQFNLTFDYPRHRLIFEPNHFYGQPEVFNRSGLRIKRNEDSWIITTLYPESPAAGARLRVGDQISRIAGLTPGEISEDDLAAVLAGPVGSQVTVEIRTKRGHRTLKLVLSDVL